jgi:hypothetical protein
MMPGPVPFGSAVGATPLGAVDGVVVVGDIVSPVSSVPQAARKKAASHRWLTEGRNLLIATC